MRWSAQVLTNFFAAAHRFQAKRGQLERFEGLGPEIQGLILALTVLCVPYFMRAILTARAARGANGQRAGAQKPRNWLALPLQFLKLTCTPLISISIYLVRWQPEPHQSVGSGWPSGGKSMNYSLLRNFKAIRIHQNFTDLQESVSE